MGLQTLYRQPRTSAYFSRYADCHSYQPPGRTAYALDHAICQLCHPIYKLIGESADRNVTIFVRTNYNSLKEAWHNWQKFGDRSRSGDCKPLIIICLMTFLISGRWCGAKLRNKYSSGLNDIRSDANVPIYRRSISSGDSPVMSAMS